MDFELLATAQGSNARAGLITTDHGTIETPIFMPVGTLGSVKAVHQHELRDDIKAQIIRVSTSLKKPEVYINSMAGNAPYLLIVAVSKCFPSRLTVN